MATGISPIEQVIAQLERGTIVTKFYWRKRPEKKVLSIRRETGQLIWSKLNSATSKNSYDGVIRLDEVKEIRMGRNSKDFEKFSEEIKRMEHTKCFMLFYGSEFKLKILSVAALSDEECDLWIRGLNYLVGYFTNAPYTLKVQCWLRREFYKMENVRETIDLKDVKQFLPKVNYKLPTSKLRETFNEVDTRKRAEICYDDFTILYQKLVFNENTYLDVLERIYPEIAKVFKTTPDKAEILQSDFEKFLDNSQTILKNSRTVTKFIWEFVADPEREIQQPYFTVTEFFDFLFSKENDLWDDSKDNVYQDMTKPLAHYWIASSHNTYLTGDQFSSESSVEAYARCLRMGCRCIELDCWDGMDGMPFIYHGHTLTTKIKFIDVIKAIREHAFVTSEFPVILSIEDNCSLPQQRKMAAAMQEVFGDMLLVHPIDRNENELPSPHVLRRRIILKHKKLPEGQEDSSLLSASDSNELDLRNSVKNGILYLEDPIDKDWNPHFFVLTQNKLFYTDRYKLDNESERSEDEDEANQTRSRSNVANEELHYCENWFHGKLGKGREEAEKLLRAYAHLGDGTFLVRTSVTFVGEYCLSFLYAGQVNHCRIRNKQLKDQVKYCLIEGKVFDSLYSLIAYYRVTPIVTSEFSLLLREPVPQPNLHENELWYHKSTGKSQAEEVLRKTSKDGAFLVRPSENDSSCYTISFRAEKKIKHCRIKHEDRLYTIGNVEFESLVDLINYYEAHPLYKKVKLNHPIGEDAVARLTTEDDNAAYRGGSYMDPSALTPKMTVKAIYDYRAQNPDELSFCKHAVITNVVRSEDSPGWCIGDYGGMEQRYFPENYVIEIDRIEPPDFGEEGPGESMMQGCVDMTGALIDILNYPDTIRFDWILRITPSTSCNVFEIAAETKDVAMDWFKALREITQKVFQVENQSRAMERSHRIAKELSNIIIYCRSITFNMDRSRQNGFIFYEMSSFPETKAEKLICQQERKFFLQYHKVQFSRVYPKGQRIDSSNYNPINIWNCGSQMVALNYQTGDKPMQINQAKFRDNGHCGYLLKPDFMLHDTFDPYDKSTLVGVTPLKISLQIIAGRHLCRAKKGIASPFVEVEVIGAPFDSGVKIVNKRVLDNGFCPRWLDEPTEFTVYNPDFALLKFLVQDEDVFGEPNFLGQAIYPVTCIRTGFRSVWLKNSYSEDLELSSLLIHIKICPVTQSNNSN